MKLYFKKQKNKLVEIFVLLNAGAIDARKEGVAHFVEHLLLSSNNIMIKELTKRGISINGYTTQDCIVVYTSILKKDLYFCLNQLNKILFDWKFNQEIFEHEKALITEEIKCENINIEKLKFTEFLSEITNINITTERGRLEIVQSLIENDVVDFYNKFIKSENSAMFINGNLNFFDELFIKKKYLTNSNPKCFSKVNINHVIKKQNLNLSNKHIFIFIENNGLYEKDKIAYELFLIIYFSELSNFWNKCRNKNNFCYYIDYENIFINNWGFSSVQIDVDNKNVDNVLNILNNNLINYDVDDELFNLAKDCLYKRMCEDYDKNVSFEAILKRKIYDNFYSFKKQVDYLKSINIENFKNFARYIIESKKYSILIQD